MPDYITRDEFEAAIAALQCVGDSQTIDVTQSPGGQTIRSIQVIGDDADTVSYDDYVSISYDSGTEKFTVTVTDLPYSNLWGAGDFMQIGNVVLGTVSATLIFDKPLSNASLKLFIHGDRTASSSVQPKIYWSDPSTNLVVTDATTLGLEVESYTYLSEIYDATLKTDGTITLLSKIDAPARLIVPSHSSLLKVYVTTSTRTIALKYRNDISGIQATSTFNYTEPFDDKIILTWDNGDTTYGLDAEDNKGSYDQTREVGYVKIDSNNRIKVVEEYKDYTPMGFNGSAAASATLTVRSGRIVNVT